MSFNTEYSESDTTHTISKNNLYTLRFTEYSNVALQTSNYADKKKESVLVPVAAQTFL